MLQQFPLRMLKLPEVESRSGLKHSSLYSRAKDELFTPPVKLSSRSSAWPEHEVEAINRARLAGKSDDEVRQLVRDLVAQRAQASGGQAA